MNVASRKRPSRFRRRRYSPGQWSKIVHFFYLPSLFKTQKKQLIWDPFFYGCPRAVKLNNTSKMVSYDRQTRHQCIVLHRLLSNFFWWSHWTLTNNYIYTLFLAVCKSLFCTYKIWLFFLKFIYSEKATKFCKISLLLTGTNQIYIVTLKPRQLTQASFLQKNQTLQNVFLISVTLRWHRASVACKNQSL